MERMTITMANGRSRRLSSPEKLREIDPDREALFMFDSGDVYVGYCDGVINSQGNFYIEGTVCIAPHLFGQLIGWCYLESK